MTNTQRLAVQALNDRGYEVVRFSGNLARFATPAVALNAADFLTGLGVFAHARYVGGQWACEII